MRTGDRIRIARIERGLTQKQLGELCGMADSAIRRYESGRGNPTLKTLQRIADALNADIIYLISGQTETEFKNEILIQAEAEAKAEFEKLQLESQGRSYGDRVSLSSALIRLFKLFGRFNLMGQREAVKRVEELTVIPLYQRTDAPQSTPDSNEGKDTTSPPDAPETPPED